MQCFMDKITPEQRSFLMSRIKGKNTKPELIMFEALEEYGIKFERHYKLLGSPDVVFPKERLAVFIDGDFWHSRTFKKRKDALHEYWVKKISRNMRRDKRYSNYLRKQGWCVVRLWEYKILKDPGSCVSRVTKKLNKVRINLPDKALAPVFQKFL